MPAKKPTTGKNTVAKSTSSKTATPASKAVAKPTATAAKTPAKTASTKAASAKVTKPAAKATVKKAVEKTATKAPAKVEKAPAKSTSKPAKTPADVATPKKAAAVKTDTAAKPTKQAAKTTVEPAKTTPKKSVEKSSVSSPKQSTKAKASQTTLATFTPYQASSGEDYMNEEQRNHFRNILLQWKSNLMEEVDRTVSHMKDEAANFPDPADRATQEEEFSFELRTRDRERKLIKKIDQTIERIDNDDYGYCDACGVDIGIKRLEARPTATLCIDCKTLAEIREKQEHG